MFAESHQVCCRDGLLMSHLCCTRLFSSKELIQISVHCFYHFSHCFISLSLRGIEAWHLIFIVYTATCKHRNAWLRLRRALAPGKVAHIGLSWAPKVVFCTGDFRKKKLTVDGGMGCVGCVGEPHHHAPYSGYIVSFIDWPLHLQAAPPSLGNGTWSSLQWLTP